MRHGKEDHRLAVRDAAFVIFAGSTVPPDPSEGALNDPAFGNDMEAREVVGALHYLQSQMNVPLRPYDKLARVAAVGPDAAEAGK